MRTLLFLLSALGSLAIAAVSYTAVIGKLTVAIYAVIMTLTCILLIFACGHLLYICYFHPKDDKKNS